MLLGHLPLVCLALLHPIVHHVEIARSLSGRDEAVIGPLGHGRKGFRSGIVRWRRGELGVVRVGEPRHRRGLDGKRVQPPAGITALLEDSLGGVLVGPLAVKLT
jgi:hypothetical protein